MNYWVVSVFYQGREMTPRPELYATPFQAQQKCDAMMAARGPSSILHHVYKVRPATWQEREQAMFTAEVYKRPVWAEERFWAAYGDRFKEHYVHVSLADDQSIAFTEDDRKGEADRQTLMRPGKYLQKFLGAGPDGTIEYGPLKGEDPKVSKQQIAFYAEWHKVGKRPPSEDTLEFTQDERRMVDAYEEGPDSCMMGKGWDFENHPVRVYAGGGLALALLLSSSSGEVIGRALCWPDREVFGRVYPTPVNDTTRDRYDELKARLKALGWTSIEENGDVFNGAKLRYLSNRWGDTMMPYLDHEYGVYRNGDWYIMDNSEHHQDNTDGTYNSGEPEYEYTCERCDEGIHEYTV